MPDHPIVHIEFSASEPKAAGEFYATLFGWEMAVDPEMGYVMFTPPSGPAGGFNPVTDDLPAGTVLVYVQTDDIEVTLAKVKSLGGRVLVPKTEIPNVGWFGIFSDPTGNSVGLYSGKEEE